MSVVQSPSTNVRAETHDGEVVISRDPLALAKGIVRMTWLWATGAIVVLVTIGVFFRHSISWGDAPTWVVAITTLLAFLAAGFAGLVAYDLLRVETGRDLKAAEDRMQADEDRRRAEEERAAQRETDRRAQASMVAAWFALGPAPYRDPRTQVWGAWIRNASDLPVLDIQVFFNYIAEETPGGDWSPVPRGGPPEKIRVMPPQAERFVEIPHQISKMIDECNAQIYAASIEFTDAAGNSWERDARGALISRD